MTTTVKWGTEQTLNPRTKDIISLNDGRFFSVWESAQTPTSSAMLYGQFYGADGMAMGGPILIRGEPTGLSITESIVSLAVLDDGNIAVSWEAANGDAFFRADLQVVRPDGSLSGPAIGDAYGQFVLMEDGQFALLKSTGYQIYNSDGTADGNLNAYSNGQPPYYSGWGQLQRLSDGRFIATKSVFPSNTELLAQIFNADFSTSGPAFQLSSPTVNRIDSTKVQQLQDGHLVAVWISSTPWAPGEEVVYSAVGQIFYPDGTKVGSEFTISTGSVHTQNRPALLALNDGRFVVSWREEGDTLKAQVFNPDGSVSGSAFEVAAPLGNLQFSPTMQALADGRFLVKWDSVDGLYETSDRFQIFDPRQGPVTLTGEVTADHLVGTRWADVINGGFGNDVLAGGNGNDTIYGEWGNDTLKGDGGNDRLYGGAGNDALHGGAGSDELWSGDGNDTLDGGAGNDAMIGGLGNDTYLVNSLLDLVIENANEGTDTVTSNSISLNLSNYAEVENASLTGNKVLNLTGSLGNNVLMGNGGANLIDGGAGNDTLNGASGNDTLVGGLGTDSMTGGNGADVFRFLTVSDSVGSTVATRDVITDFQRGIDKIDLSAIDARINLAGDQAFTFIGTAAFSGTNGGQLRYVGGILSGNVNGDLVADFQIQLTGSPAITAADIIL